MPRGAPGLFPPCSRHRPFFIAGCRHIEPARVVAPHLGAVDGLPGGLPFLTPYGIVAQFPFLPLRREPRFFTAPATARSLISQAARLGAVSAAAVVASGAVTAAVRAALPVRAVLAPAAAAVPEPASIALLGAGLVSLAALRRRRRANTLAE